MTPTLLSAAQWGGIVARDARDRRLASDVDEFVPQSEKDRSALVGHVAALDAALKRLRDLAAKDDHAICQALGRALGYPRYVDSPEIFPNATDADGVCTADHVGATIAAEAAEWIVRRKAMDVLVRSVLVDADKAIEAEGAATCALMRNDGLLGTHSDAIIDAWKARRDTALAALPARRADHG